MPTRLLRYFQVAATVIAVFLLSASAAYAFTVFQSGQVGSSPTKGSVLQTDGTNSSWVATSTLGISSGGSSFAYPFTNTSYGGATSTVLDFSAGLVTNASTTLAQLGTGIVQATNGLLSAAALTSGQVTTALGFTPYNATNPSSYIALSALSGTYPVIDTSGTFSLAFGTTTANTFSLLQTFGNASTTVASFNYASATAAFLGQLTLPTLGTPAGSFLAVNGTGQVIATTSPSGGGGTGTVGTGTTGQVPYYAAGGTTLTATSTLFIGSNGSVDIGTTSAAASAIANFAISNTAQAIYINDSADAIPLNSFGFFPVGNGTLKFGFTSGSNISCTFSQACSLVGTWTFPVNGAYPSPLLGFSNGSGGQIGLVINTSGTGSNQTVYAFTPDFAGSGNAANFSLATNGLTLGINNCFTLSYTTCVTGGNSTAVLTIASTTLIRGNVGIGTTTPEAELSVSTTTSAVNTQLFNIASSTGATLFNVLGNGAVYINSLGTPAGAFLAVNPLGQVIATTTPSSGGSGTVTSIATTYPVTGGTFTTSGTIGLAFGTTTSNTWAGTQSFTSAPILTSLTGNIAAGATGTLYATGTSTPTLGLGLSYSGTLGQFIAGTSGSLTIATSSLYTGTTGQFPYFSGTNAISATSSLFLSTSGNMGIGTTTPTSLLTVAGNFLLQTFTNVTNAFTIKNAAGVTDFNVDTTASSPSFGIGTSSPAASLDIDMTSASSTPLLLEGVSGCIIVKDVQGAGYTQIYTQAGTTFSKVHTGALSSCN